MAYTLQSLIHILEHTLLPQNHHQNFILHQPVFESLLEKVNSLKDMLESCPPSLSKELEGVEGKIRDASLQAEDIIESLTAGVTSTISSQKLQKVMQEFHSAKEMLSKIVDVDTDVDGSRIQESEPNASLLFAPRQDLSDKDLVVGLEADLDQLKDRLTSDQSKLNIIPIVGMGGLGKTTLAQKVYDDALVASHFDIRAWVAVSQDYNFRAVLLGLLRRVIGTLTEKILKMQEPQLGEMLHKSLHGRRYLIVFDDMWSTDVWDDIKRFLPDNKNRSRIMFTTRESNVAKYACPEGEHHQMHLLNKFDSWELLRKVFFQEHCPPSLEKIAEEIVENCRGLPLAISVIGGLLSTAKLDQKFWKEVANNTSSIVANEDQFSNIFQLSYNYLPPHLKPCFLYFGAFPEDSNIRSSKLVRLWVAEGFLKPIRGKSLEEAAEVYLKSLVDRNLISIRERESKQRVKSYGIHDLLRELCLKKAIQEKFFVVANMEREQLANDISFIRRVSVNPPGIWHIYDLEDLMSFSRSFLCTGLASPAILSPIFLSLRLLRVLDVLEVEFHRFPQEILQLVNLRYLGFGCRSHLFPNLEKLINLQTLIVLNPQKKFEWPAVPSGLWELQQLRHVEFKGMYIKYFTSKYPFACQNIQTLSYVAGHLNCWESFPNLRTLGIVCFFSYGIVPDLSQLEKLETLECITNFPSSEFDSFSDLALPPSLKKLSLYQCPISPRLMSKIGSLPNLEVLNLKDCTFQDMPGPGASGEAEWEGEFSQHQLLWLEDSNLVSWK